MSETINIEDLARQIADHVRPAVPIEYAVWDIKDIAGYLRKTPPASEAQTNDE